MGKVYGVRSGRNPGIYTSWLARVCCFSSFRWIDSWNREKCLEQVKGVSKAQYRSFSTMAEAKEWMKGDEKEKNHIKKEIKKKKKPRDLDRIRIWTDGSSFFDKQNLSDQTKSRAGSGVYFGDNDPRNRSERLPGECQTNQRAEVYAAILAIQAAGGDKSIEILTDSRYVINAMTSWIFDWKKDEKKFNRVHNKDLFVELDNLCSKCKTRPIFTYVPAHTGIEGNEAADKLAKEGAMKPNILDGIDFDEDIYNCKSDENIIIRKDIPYFILSNPESKKDSILIAIFDETVPFNITEMLSKNFNTSLTTILRKENNSDMYHIRCFTYQKEIIGQKHQEINCNIVSTLAASFTLFKKYENIDSFTLSGNGFDSCTANREENTISFTLPKIKKTKLELTEEMKSAWWNSIKQHYYDKHSNCSVINIKSNNAIYPLTKDQLDSLPSNSNSNIFIGSFCNENTPKCCTLGMTLIGEEYQQNFTYPYQNLLPFWFKQSGLNTIHQVDINNNPTYILKKIGDDMYSASYNSYTLLSKGSLLPTTF